MARMNVMILMVVMATAIFVSTPVESLGFPAWRRHPFERFLSKACDYCCDQCRDQEKERKDNLKQTCEAYEGSGYCGFSGSCYYGVETTGLTTFEDYNMACNLADEGLPGRIINAGREEFESTFLACIREFEQPLVNFTDGLIGEEGNGDCTFVSIDPEATTPFTYETKMCSENVFGAVLCYYDGFDC